MEKLVSVVLPVYNGEKYLRESIESVLNQTYRNIELIIVDDCSIDSTQLIAREYVRSDSRVKYYRNQKNLKLPRNLNRGFSLARGEYLTWTSDDNRYKPKAIATLVEKLEGKKDVQFAFASCRVIDGNGKEIEYIMVNENSPKQIIGSNSVGACFMYTRKVYETIGDYDPELVLVEDFDYWQRICMKFKAVGIPDILYEYRWHDGALTSTMRQDEFNRNLEKMLLKNRSGFGRTDMESSYYYYRGLNRCRVNLKMKENPYIYKYKFYSMYYFLFFRLPNKVARIGKSIKKMKLN